ncbi:unnamed protein product [Brassicogethes aeneus]|uniref:Uncharacterized protein n=1 Tax=Brassicogethes aeneus TaxID=1431903 RepID=A0A9P0BC20_BRAAE|nr:unnamed protein product [Brassicogethes aeneus]
MRGIYLILLFLVNFTGHLLTQVPPQVLGNQHVKQEKRISQQILDILEHYKQKDPVGIPGAPIPDPLDVPPIQRSISFSTIKMMNMKMYGLKNFRISSVKANIAKMEVEAALDIDTLNVIGNYTLSTLFSSTKGPFTVKLSKVYVKATAKLEIDKDGHLEAQDMLMDMKFKDMSMDFKNLGSFASLLQGIMNSMGTFVFDSIKPFVIEQVSRDIRKQMNTEVQKFPKKFPNSITPFDQLVSEVRKKVRKMGYDPYRVPDYNTTVGVLDIYLSHTWVYGISSFYRTRDIVFEVKNNTVSALLEVGTQKLLGTSHWNFNLVAGMMTRSGTIEFSVEYIKVAVLVSQTMDTRNPPNLDDIQIELGNIQIRFDGLGTTDYFIEFAINVLPNLLRYQIMDALEKPVKLRIQEVLNTVNVEKLVRENADKIDDQKALEKMF